MVNWTDGPTTEEPAPLRADVVVAWLRWLENRDPAVQAEVARILSQDDHAGSEGATDDQAA